MFFWPSRILTFLLRPSVLIYPAPIQTADNIHASKPVSELAVLFQRAFRFECNHSLSPTKSLVHRHCGRGVSPRASASVRTPGPWETCGIEVGCVRAACPEGVGPFVALLYTPSVLFGSCLQLQPIPRPLQGWMVLARAEHCLGLRLCKGPPALSQTRVSKGT